MSLRVLRYRPFESWAAGTEWTCTFPQGEEVKAVAVGATFAAAATGEHLRLYSLAGNPQAVLALPGKVVALAANESWLALIYHGGEPTRTGKSGSHGEGEAPAFTQKLAFALYDVASEQEVGAGAVPLSPGAELEWAGFSEDGILSCCDDQGCIRGLFLDSFGGSWTPLFRSQDARKAETEHHYVVGLSQREVFAIITKSARHVPQVEPRPIISTLQLILCVCICYCYLVHHLDSPADLVHLHLPIFRRRLHPAAHVRVHLLLCIDLEQRAIVWKVRCTSYFSP